MDWAGKTHPVEKLAELVAPIVLAGAAGWAAVAAGLPLPAKVAAVVAALLTGIAVMRIAGSSPNPQPAGFEPVEFEPSSLEDELLLDDPLVEVADDSRVVRLFARTEPTPGELVLRISDYLSEQGKAAPSLEPVADQQIDASAALHAALANIRATLR